MVCRIRHKPLNPKHSEATQAGLCVACWDEPFAIASVSRGDLAECLTPAQIGGLDDADMHYLAGKLADAYLDQVFWIDLEILSKQVLDEAGQ